jgi:hypothetical protein
MDIIYSFIYSLYNYASSSLDYIELKETMTSEW